MTCLFQRCIMTCLSERCVDMFAPGRGGPRIVMGQSNISVPQGKMAQGGKEGAGKTFGS